MIWLSCGDAMDMRAKKIIIRSIAVISACCVLAAVFTFLINKTSTPGYCATCHVMAPQYEAWFMTGVHRNIRCVDCHLPHTDPVSYLFWKGMDGMKDVLFFYGRLYPDRMKISSHGARTAQKNCLRCHEQMVSRIETGDRDCWQCHRRINHTYPDKSLALENR